MAELKIRIAPGPDKGAGRGILSDPSALSLLATNLGVIAFAIFENWGLLTVMLIYWCQSVIIGTFTIIKILGTGNNGEQIPAIINGKDSKMGLGAVKIIIAGFFTLHYGLFHFVYLMFIAGFAFTSFGFGSSAQGIDFLSVFISAMIFFINHLFSYLYHQKQGAGFQASMGDITSSFTAPYARIIPMHLTIIFGFGF